MLKLLLGDPNTRKLKRYQPIVEEINFLEEEISTLTDDDLRKETHNLKSKISEELDIKKQKQLLEDFLPKAFAIVREASKRVLDMRHFDVQLIGGVVFSACAANHPALPRHLSRQASAIRQASRLAM